MSIIRATNSEQNDAIHEVIMDIEERALCHGLPAIGMFETTDKMSVNKAPVTTISMLPEDFHIMAYMSKDQRNGSVVVYDTIRESNNPRVNFERVFQISYADGEASLSKVSLVAAGFCFNERGWFDGTTAEEIEGKVEKWACAYWPGFTDEVIDLVRGIETVRVMNGRNEDVKNTKLGRLIFNI